MNIGDKVVCIDGKFPPAIASLYTALPVEGQTYVIRDIRLGIRMLPKKEGDVSLLLTGLVNPNADSKAALERGFSESRFRPLEEVKAQVTTHQRLGAHVEKVVLQPA